LIYINQQKNKTYRKEVNEMLLYNVGKTGVMLVAGSIVGLLYAVFLPFIGIAMTLVMIGKKLVSGLVHVAVKCSSFGWRPIEAYLDGKQRRKKEAKEMKRHEKM
jgi:hypothetical protein